MVSGIGPMLSRYSCPQSGGIFGGIMVDLRK